MSKTLARLPHNIWNSPVIRTRLKQEAGFECDWGKPSLERYYAVVPQTDSPLEAIELRNYDPHSPLTPDPHELQMHFIQAYREQLQKQIHHDGVWIVAWTHPPEVQQALIVDGDNTFGRLIAIWLDEDADPMFTFETDLPFVEIVANGGHYYIEQAEKAWYGWNKDFGKKAMKEDFGIKEHQTSKDALSALH